MKINKKSKYMIGVAIVCIILLVAYSLYTQDSYVLSCAKAETFESYKSCVYLNDVLNK